MALTRWEPRDLFGLRRELDSMFDTFLGRGERFAVAWTPPMDVTELENEIQIQIELPGMKADDINVSITNNIMTLSGEKKEESERRGEDFHVKERTFGSFTRSVTLPSVVNADKITARFTDGILKISLPKAEEARAKRIEVKAS